MNTTSETDWNKIWNKSLKKANRFKILEDPECPNSIVYKALFLYPPEEVLSIPAIALKTLWLLDDQDSFLKDCIYLSTATDRTPTALLGHKYSKAKHYNLLYYLECVYTPHNIRHQAKCIHFLNNKAYIKRCFKVLPSLKSDLISEFIINTPSTLGRLLLIHFYSKDCITYDEFSELLDYIVTTPHLTSNSGFLQNDWWCEGREFMSKLIKSEYSSGRLSSEVFIHASAMLLKTLLTPKPEYLSSMVRDRVFGLVYDFMTKHNIYFDTQTPDKLFQNIKFFAL